MCFHNTCRNTLFHYSFTQHDIIIIPSEVNLNCVFAIDDIATEKQDCIIAYFATGR